MPRGPRTPLPPFLKSEPFTVAQGKSIGLGRGRLRGIDLERPFRGIRVAHDEGSASPRTGSRGARVGESEPSQRAAVAAGAGPLERGAAEGVGVGHGTAARETERGTVGQSTLGQGTFERELAGRCSALLVALPDGAHFTHVTAARLWPLPLPRPSLNEPLHVGVFSPARAPRRNGVVGHHIHDRLTSVRYRRGLPLTDPATLFCQLTAVSLLHDLVAAGDALILDPVYPDEWEERPWVTIEQLRTRVELFRGRGKQSATRALTLIRPGAESRPETLLRLAIVDAGLPEPEVNSVIRDASGRFLGRGDLVYCRWRVIVEYDGEQHLTTTAQFDRDVQRLEGFARVGWTVIRIVGRSFFGDRDACLRRIAHALVAAGWCP